LERIRDRSVQTRKSRDVRIGSRGGGWDNEQEPEKSGQETGGKVGEY